ncbi:MAG: polyprenyl synthetase family protein [Ardenticatenia bacterium]|nr:polyprenyl synthetase family protein [Ardenticatenia bacterium]
MAIQTLPLFAPIEEDLEAVVAKMRHAARVNLELLDTALAHVVASGGKLVRPALAIAATRLAAGEIEYPKMISLAASVEMLHTATLVHDDMIDQAARRRGNPTLHTVLNPASAVLLGDYLLRPSGRVGRRDGQRARGPHFRRDAHDHRQRRIAPDVGPVGLAAGP